MIKNHTPYIGEIFLKFEKYPWYTARSTLNSIHLDLGFIKLVSRIKPKRHKKFLEIDPKKLKLIELLTGGTIRDYPVDGREGPEWTIPNSFVTEDGTYLGDIRDAWFYVENRLIISPTNPGRVAIQVKKDLFELGKKGKSIESYSESFIDGFYGYTHRGGAIFRKGDRLFDPDYYPKMEDYDAKEWKKYRKKMKKYISEKYQKMENTRTKSIKELIPFTRRGKIIIETWEQAERAALNLSNHL